MDYAQQWTGRHSTHGLLLWSHLTTGLSKLRYHYVNIDDCWAELTHDDKGNLVPKNSTFPSGIKALADYGHSKGLELRIYSDAGTRDLSTILDALLKTKKLNVLNDIINKNVVSVIRSRAVGARLQLLILDTVMLGLNSGPGGAAAAIGYFGSAQPARKEIRSHSEPLQLQIQSTSQSSPMQAYNQAINNLDKELNHLKNAFEV